MRRRASFLTCQRASRNSNPSQPKTNVSGADLAALAARVDKIEAALAAPKTETAVPSSRARR